MGEYLQLISDHLSDGQLHELVAKELAEYPNLVQRLDVQDQVISTKLATCEHVFFTFAEMVALHRFIRRHLGLLRFGPAHSCNATPEQILNDRSSLYLGASEPTTPRWRRTPVPDEAASNLEHREVWRRTIRTMSLSGRWYQRRLRRDETSGVPGNPNGRRIPCPNSGRVFRAVRVGFAWDPATALGRDIYRCPRCLALFNLGESPRPGLQELAAELPQQRQPDAEQATPVRDREPSATCDGSRAA